MLAAVTTLSYFSTSPYTQSPTAIFSQYNNADLKWEKTGQLNIGLDFGFAGNKVSGSIEYYRKNASQLYGTAPVDYTGIPVNTIIKNVAAMQGNGVDIALNALLLNRTIKWMANGNFSYNTDKVTNYYLDDLQGSNFIGGLAVSGIVGKPVYAVFGYKWAGLDPANGSPRGYIDGKVSNDYFALTGSATQVKDLAYYGSAFPKWYGSVGNTVSYKNWSVTARISYKLGYYFMKSSTNYSDLFSRGTSNADFANRWQKPGDELTTNVPAMIYPADYQSDAFYSSAAINILKGDHIRWQYINLAYDFAKENYKKLPFQNIRLYINAADLGIIWKANKAGIDPDYRNTTIPPSKSIAIGCRISF